MSEPTETPTPSSPPATWPGRWSALSFSAPFAAMLLTIVVVRGFGRTDADTMITIAAINIVLVGAGLVLGLAAVVGSVRMGRRGWMIRAMLGTLLNGFSLMNAAAMYGESGL